MDNMNNEASAEQVSAAEPISAGEENRVEAPEQTAHSAPETVTDQAAAQATAAEAMAAKAAAETSGSKIKRILSKAAIILGFAIIFIVGLSILLYPKLSNYINEKNQSRVIEAYRLQMEALSQIDYEQLLLDAQDYNDRLFKNGGTVTDAFEASSEDAAEQESNNSDGYWDLINPQGDGVMGYLTIEKINVKLAIYHGTHEVVLDQGVGHLRGTSLPVGGNNTHAVLTTHTGLPSAKLFSDLDQLKEGDTFQVHILGQVLTYQVDQIAVVLPFEVDYLKVAGGEDYLTLVTCTPYGVNDHRLLVRGKRIETPAEDLAKEEETINSETTAATPADQKKSWLKRASDTAFTIFANVFEKTATGFVDIADGVMNIFGVPY